MSGIVRKVRMSGKAIAVSALQAAPLSAQRAHTPGATRKRPAPRSRWHRRASHAVAANRTASVRDCASGPAPLACTRRSPDAARGAPAARRAGLKAAGCRRAAERPVVVPNPLRADPKGAMALARKARSRALIAIWALAGALGAPGGG